MAVIIPLPQLNSVAASSAAAIAHTTFAGNVGVAVGVGVGGRVAELGAPHSACRYSCFGVP
jgi:hypothetical protein